MASTQHIPDFLKGNVPLQRRYFAALRRASYGCNSNCYKAKVARQYQKLAIQLEVKKVEKRGRKR
jgi:hypothetical protein